MLPIAGAVQGMVFANYRCKLSFSRFQRRVQRLHELIDLDRLGQIAEKSGLEAAQDVVGYRVGAQGHDGYVRRRGVGAQDLHGLGSARVALPAQS